MQLFLKHFRIKAADCIDIYLAFFQHEAVKIKPSKCLFHQFFHMADRKLLFVGCSLQNLSRLNGNQIVGGIAVTRFPALLLFTGFSGIFGVDDPLLSAYVAERLKQIIGFQLRFQDIIEHSILKSTFDVFKILVSAQYDRGHLRIF